MRHVWLGLVIVFAVAGCATKTPEVKPITSSCAAWGDVAGVTTAAFESRAAQSVQFLENYIKRLDATLEVLRNSYAQGDKVCRLYALDELADIYTHKLVKFDLADQTNTEAERLLSEIACCRGAFHFNGTFYPPNRQIYSYMFTLSQNYWRDFLYPEDHFAELARRDPSEATSAEQTWVENTRSITRPNRVRVKGDGLSASLYPEEYLAEVIRRDLDEVALRVRARKLILDRVLQRSDNGKPVSRPLQRDILAHQEFQWWRETLQLVPSLTEKTKALLILDRVWRLREYFDEPTWLALVRDAGQTAIAYKDKETPSTSPPAILVRFRLGYALLRTGHVEEGVRLYEEMLERLAIYQGELESEYRRVQSTIFREKIKAGAKTVLTGGLIVLSAGFTVVAAYYGGEAGARVGAYMIEASVSGLDSSLTDYGLARYKSLETVRLFGNVPRALPLLLNEHERLEFHRELGSAFERLDRRQLAIDHYKNAIEIIESERAGLGGETARQAFLQGKETVYARLVLLLVKAGDPSGAFLYAERARSRNFVDILASAGPKFRNVSESAMYLQRQRDQAEVDFTVQLSGLTYQEVVGMRGAQRGVQVKQGRLPTTTTDTSSQPAKDEESAPEISMEFESLTSVRAASLADITGQVGENAAMVAFFVGEEETAIFLLQDDRCSAWIRPVGRLALHKQVETFRRLIQTDPQNSAKVVAIEKAGQELYRILLGDAMGVVRKRVVYLAPHGPLHYLPFAALHDGSRYLVDRVTLINIPSGTVLTYLKKKIRAEKGSIVVFANPDLGDPQFDLPFAEQEGDAVLARKPLATLLKRKEAQEVRARTLGSQATILHFATHAKFNVESPLDSALLLVPGNGEDGSLTAAEIFGFALPGSLVVLSACETGLGKVATGDEILGLTRAFMYAGAPQLIATLWEIDDQATSELMDHLYGRLSKERSASALRAAQIHLRKRYPHPFFWSGFVSHGVE